MEHLADSIVHLQGPLETAFRLRERCSTDGSLRHGEKRRALTLVNKVLTAWSKSRLVAIKDTRKQYKMNGKKFSTYDYRMENKYNGDLTEACGRVYHLSELWER